MSVSYIEERKKERGAKCSKLSHIFTSFNSYSNNSRDTQMQGLLSNLIKTEPLCTLCSTLLCTSIGRFIPGLYKTYHLKDYTIKKAVECLHVLSIEPRRFLKWKKNDNSSNFLQCKSLLKNIAVDIYQGSREIQIILIILVKQRLEIQIILIILVKERLEIQIILIFLVKQRLEIQIILIFLIKQRLEFTTVPF